MLSFVPLGVGDAFSAHNYSSCLAVNCGEEWLLIDCPHPIRKMLREASTKAGVAIPEDKIRGVALTHLHADHCSGLESWAYFCFFALGHKAPLYCHKQVRKRLWEGSLAAGMERLILDGKGEHKGFDDYFEWTELTLAGRVKVGPFEIECRKTIHHIPTTAFRIYGGGRCLAYSADTSFDESLIEWLSEGDLIVHETNYGVHTPYEKLAALPAELRARMRLIHYPDDFDLAASVIEPLMEGRRYEVGSA